MGEPLVSVVIITYNHVNYISHAIEGVLNQKTSFPFELVIGEDCSTDGTRDIIYSIKNRHPDLIRVITSDRNVGMVNNFIRTSNACLGKYIAFCEGDDYWHRQDKLQLQFDYLEANQDCGLICSDYDVRDIKSNKTIINFIAYKKWKLPTNFRISDWVSDKTEVPILTVTVMVRRDLCEKVIKCDPYLYENGSFLMYDWPLWAEMSELAKVGYIQDSLATYNVSENSVTRPKDIEKDLKFTISIYKAAIYLCEKYKLSEQIKLYRKRLLCSATLNLAWRTQDGKLADEVMTKNNIKLSWKDWYKYYAAKYSAVYYSYIVISLIKKILIGEGNKWYE